MGWVEHMVPGQLASTQLVRLTHYITLLLLLNVKCCSASGSWIIAVLCSGVSALCIWRQLPTLQTTKLYSAKTNTLHAPYTFTMPSQYSVIQLRLSYECLV